MATEAMRQVPVRPFEGREEEIEHLLERWRLARDGSGQVVQLCGAPGIGKSRLVDVFAEHTATEPRAFLLCQCSQHRQDSAFGPLLDLLWRLEESSRGNPEEQVAAKRDPEARLHAMLAARLKALLLPAPLNQATSLHLNPEGRARRTLESLLELFLESAKRQPMLLVIEDLEWIDPSTFELVTLLAHRKPNVPLMVVLTFTPTFEPPWGHRAHLTTINLMRLSRRQVEAVLDELIRDEPLQIGTRSKIIALADGVPLYIEELVRLAQELDSSKPLPITLKQWLRLRLGQMETTRDIAQLAAILGVSLASDQLRELSGLDDADLEHALENLVKAEILTRRKEPGTDFGFRHSLIRDAVLASMSKEERSRAHRSTAQMLTDSFAEMSAQQPERMAYHYTEAGMLAEGAAARRAAAKQALRRGANLEAAAHCRSGLELLESLPANDSRSVEEIALRIVLGAALGTAKGYADEEAQAAYDRAVEIAWQAPTTLDLLSDLQEMASYYLARGQVRTAREIADRARAQAESRDQPDTQSTARRTLGFAQMLEGNFEEAVENLEQSQAPYAVHRSLMQATPPALGIPLAESLSHMALARWFLGFPSQALKHSTDSLTLAQRFNDPFSRVFTIHRACYLHVFRREPIATRELAHELVEVANRHGFLFFIAIGMFLEGQALTAQGRAAEGLQMMSGGLDGAWASGMEVGRPRNLALLAEACGRSELFEQGLSLIKEGIAAAEITGEAHYEPELYRIQGELLLQAEFPTEEVEQSLLQAIAIAKRQKSRSLELRASISIGRLWNQLGKARQAGELLRTVHSHFAEGFDTADLKEAKELIDQLS